MAQKHGEADAYYSAGQQQPPMQYQQPPQPSYQGRDYQDPKYQQAPPNYGQNYNAGAPPPQGGGDYGKQSYDQVFKLEKPKYNDLWAGILVLALPTQLSFNGFAQSTLGTRIADTED